MSNSAALVKADGTVKVLGHRPTLAEAQEFVGGYVEFVKARNSKGTVTLVVDEEGKLYCPNEMCLNELIYDECGNDNQ